MGYMHINNLYKDQAILGHDYCYALEKIHGTSAHVGHDQKLRFFSGGAQHDQFVALFDQEHLETVLGGLDVVIYGEAYGGKMQRMSRTYGPNLKFVAFDVKTAGRWLNVPDASQFVMSIGLEFVDYRRLPADLTEINRQRDLPSEQARRNGMGNDKVREGIVLRPIIEQFVRNNHRLIAKHKNAEFCETKTPREVDPEKQKILSDAREVAEEWVTAMRLEHVLDKIPDAGMEQMPQIIGRMKEDIRREGEGEIKWSRPVETAIGRATAIAMKARLMAQLAAVN